jgi:precorrin-8X/cobalt-precorrin-8 methylmutase
MQRNITFDYEKDGAAIYRQSFATIRAEADLAAFPDDLKAVAVRIIHGCGMVDIASRIRFSANLGDAARSALRDGRPILCDSEMVAHGVTRARLPAGNAVVCTLRDPSVPAHAATISNTRTAAALDLWGDRLDGAVVVIGNAPTALFRLMEMIAAGGPKPSAILGFPVGFVGAAESKDALIAHHRDLGVEYVTVTGRQGGSAMAASALNALASDVE